MRLLAELLPALDATQDWTPVIEDLAHQNIHHDITLAFTNKPLSHPGAQQAQDLVLRFLAAPAETAERAIKRQSRGVYIRTPIHSLNTMLHGGWPVGQLSGISSAQAVGKTLLALSSALQFLIDRPEARALWVDTEGAFSPDRAYACARALCQASSASRVRDAEILLVLDRLQHTCATDLPTALDALDRFAQRQKNDARVHQPEPSLILIDSISALFKDKVNTPSSQGNASMVSTLRFLRSIAENQLAPAAVLLVNDTVSCLPTNPQSAFANVKQKPALGKTFLSIIDSSVLLSKADDVFASHSKLRGGLIAELLKSKDHVAGHWCLFKSDGIVMCDEAEPASTAGNAYQGNLAQFVK